MELKFTFQVPDRMRGCDKRPLADVLEEVFVGYMDAKRKQPTRAGMYLSGSELGRGKEHAFDHDSGVKVWFDVPDQNQSEGDNHE